MIGPRKIVIVSVLGLLTTSSSMVGAALGLYFPLSKRVVAGAGSVVCLIAEACLSIEMVAFSLVPQGRDADAQGHRGIFKRRRQREHPPDVLLLDLLEC